LTHSAASSLAFEAGVKGCRSDPALSEVEGLTLPCIGFILFPNTLDGVMTMSIDFNADEIFQLGIQIETNGKQFYETVARNTMDLSVKGLFSELTKWESEHQQLFENLRKALPDSAKKETLFDPDGEQSLYLKTMAETHVFVKNRDVAGLASRCKTSAEALDLAIAFEKDSIVFFTTMKGIVPEHLGKDKIDLLINEEIKHISILTQKRKELGI
jgi:rubrerythrin